MSFLTDRAEAWRRSQALREEGRRLFQCSDGNIQLKHSNEASSDSIAGSVGTRCSEKGLEISAVSGAMLFIGYVILSTSNLSVYSYRGFYINFADWCCFVVRNFGYRISQHKMQGGTSFWRRRWRRDAGAAGAILRDVQSGEAFGGRV